MKKFKQKNYGEEEYWKSFTDMMAGLLLLVILIMALLFLYLTQMSANSNGGAYTHSASPDSRPIPTLPHFPTMSPFPTFPTERRETGGGSQGETRVTEPPTQPTEGGEDISKAAVYVTVVDEETGNAIKKDGITFELYTGQNRNGGLKRLNTYYPEKIEYSKYETTDNGTFYLPEKLPLGKYSLHNLTVPESYGAGENLNFEIDEPYDWPEPYYVEFPLAPAKNTIRVLMKDAQTGELIPGYTYEVIANEDIITLDGTLRYTKDQIVDEFVCNEKGYGESIKLYLGNYRIRQKEAAEYYALDSESREVVVEKNEDSETPVHEITGEKTAAVIGLTDEYSGEAIGNAVYAVKGGEDITTDASGNAVFTNLSKGTTYELSVKSLPGKYQSNAEPISVYVDENGLINGQARPVIETNAFVTRLQVSVRDRLLNMDLTGENISVFDENGEVVANLDINGSVETITGLDAGDYTVQSGGRKSTNQSVHISDQAKPAVAYIYLWTYVDFAIVFVALLIIAAAVYITVTIVKRKRVKKPDAKRETKG